LKFLRYSIPQIIGELTDGKKKRRKVFLGAVPTGRPSYFVVILAVLFGLSGKPDYLVYLYVTEKNSLVIHPTAVNT